MPAHNRGNRGTAGNQGGRKKPAKPQSIPVPNIVSERGLAQKVWSWAVVGSVVILLIGGGVSAMTSARRIVADRFFVAGAVLFLAKFQTSEEARREVTGKRIAIAVCGVLAASLVCGLAIVWNHRLNSVSALSDQHVGKLSARTVLSTGEGIIPTIEVGTSGVIFTKSIPGGPPRQEFEVGKIYIGAGQYAFESLVPILSDCDFRIETIDGEAKVSMVLLDSDGDVVAKLVKNEWDWGGRPVSFDRNYSQDSIEVQDKGGNSVLQVTVLRDRVRLQLICFRRNGNMAYLVQAKPHATGARDAIISFNNTAKEDLGKAMRPMFRYPSSLHLGELNE